MADDKDTIRRRRHLALVVDNRGPAPAAEPEAADPESAEQESAEQWPEAGVEMPPPCPEYLFAGARLAQLLMELNLAVTAVAEDPGAFELPASALHAEIADYGYYAEDQRNFIIFLGDDDNGMGTPPTCLVLECPLPSALIDMPDWDVREAACNISLDLQFGHIGTNEECSSAFYQLTWPLPEEGGLTRALLARLLAVARRELELALEEMATFYGEEE